ncbi:prepilin peptidase [Microbacterium sp.]|uniref:prepilin peptidase n=1 Tax=Microbacterium sp. TaxID=51671 RepID=UPI00391CB35A
MPGPLVAAFALFAVVSVVLAVADVRTHRVPDAVVLPAVAVGVALLAAAAGERGEPVRIAGVCLGAAGAFAACLVVHLARPSAFGGGDVKLAALVGAHLGWFGPDAVASGLALGFAAAGVAGLGVVAAGARRVELPFAPFLLLGAWARVVTGPW